MYIIKVIGAADLTPTPHDGRYVVAWDPHTDYGTVAISSTDNKDHALRYSNAMDILQHYRTVSKKDPVRPDGRKNRPLTAVHIVITKPEKEA